jgi:hypothetical protein
MTRLLLLAPALALLLALGTVPGQDKKDGKIGSLDLRTTAGVEAVKGTWHYHDVITGVGKDKNEIEPKAHGTFDDSSWEVIPPEMLKAARGPGKYSWCWYRIKLTIPDKVNGQAFAGGPVWFGTTVDDYGEIWVDGGIDTGRGRGAVAGFNTLNRVRLQKPDGPDKKKKRDARPGDVFQIAVLGINAPLGVPPGNKIFLRDTLLDFYGPDAPNGGADVPKVWPAPEGQQVAAIDLMKQDGTDLVKGTWRRHLVSFHTGPMKNEIEPQAHGTFKDDDWEKIEDPVGLAKAFGPGKFSMAWYRIKVTMPAKVGDVDVSGSEAWFRATIDDYAEVWVEGAIDKTFGTSGRGAIAGFNKPNEVLLSKDVKPGQTVQVAVLAINGPFGNPPGNKIFFHKPALIRFLKK